MGADKIISLDTLGSGIPVIPEEAAAFYKQNCMVCFNICGHKSGVILATVYDDQNLKIEICWDGQVTDELRRAYKDLQKATEFASCALALLLVRELTNYVTIEQSVRGTTIDYYLVPKGHDSHFFFNYAARLEVSGILRENPKNSLEKRIAQKVKRLRKEEGLEDLIIVVEFSQPWSKIVTI